MRRLYAEVTDAMGRPTLAEIWTMIRKTENDGPATLMLLLAAVALGLMVGLLNTLPLV